MQTASDKSNFWPRRMAWTLAVCTFLLLLVGGLVTTYRVGMAVPDWPTTFGHNMFTYPLDEMLEGFGVTIEHSHRLFASLVGLLTIGMVVSCLRERRSLLLLSVATLVVVIAQGILGGTRVLENSQELAFLHGAFAQVFYALVAALVVVTSRRWQTAGRTPAGRAPSLQRLALVATSVVYAQIVLGAWLRHSGASAALALHGVTAALVLVLVILLARALTPLSELRAVRRFLIVVLGAQVALGLLATLAIYGWSGGFAGAVSTGEAIAATLHVGVGALLLAGCVAATLWSYRLLASEAITHVHDARLEGAV